MPLPGASGGPRSQARQERQQRRDPRHAQLAFGRLAAEHARTAATRWAQTAVDPTGYPIGRLVNRLRHAGIPVSTTHTITGAIVGVGASRRLSAVRWGVAGRVVWAWIVTIPGAWLIATVTYVLVAVFS